MASPDLSYTQMLPSGDVTGELSPSQIEALTTQLCADHRALEELGRQERVRMIARTCAWLAEDGELLARMVTEGSAHTGYHPETLRQSLVELLGLFTPAALLSLLEDELGPEVPAGAVTSHRLRATERVLSSPRCCVQIHAATVPTAAMEGLLLSLCAGVPTIIRTSDHERATARFALKALRRRAPTLARHAAVVSWPSASDAHVRAAALAHPLFVCHGSDHSIAAVRAAVEDQAEVMGYGHRLSCLVIAPSTAMTGPAITRLADAIALDCALFEGQGCMSPQTAFVVPPADQPELAEQLAEALIRSALPRCAEQLPRGVMPPAVAAEQMQLAGVAAFTGHAERTAAGTVLRHDDGAFHPSPGWRLLHVSRCVSEAALFEALETQRHHLSTAGLYCNDPDQERLAQRLAAVGFRRVCRPGRMQRPVLLRAHDGVPRVRDWFRICDIES